MTVLNDSTRNYIGMRLTRRLGKAIREGQIEASNAAEACTMILTAFEAMKYQEEIVSFLKKLSAGWPFFGDVLRDVQRKKEIADDVSNMFLNRKMQYVGTGSA